MYTKIIFSSGWIQLDCNCCLLLLFQREYETDDTQFEDNSQDEILEGASTIDLDTNLDGGNDDEDKDEEDDKEYREGRSVLKLESIKTSNIQGRMFIESSEYFLGSAHKIQRWFGVGKFAMLLPSSATCRILDPQVSAHHSVSCRNMPSLYLAICQQFHHN